MMPDATTDQLIDRLAADLRPVRRLAPPWRRLLPLLAALLWVGLVLNLFIDWHEIRVRLMSTPDMWESQAGALLTALLAGFAALQTAIPGRSPAWALLPLPALALWLGASAAGCMRLATAAGTLPEPPGHAMICLEFLLLVAVPLCALLTWQMRRACPLRPGLTAGLAGLASAAGAAVLLTLIHPFDATAGDLAMHGAGIVAVVLGMRIGAKGLLF